MPSPITFTSIWTASRRCGPISVTPHRSGCTSRAIGRNSNCIYGQFWKTAHAIADAGAPIPPPDIDSQDDWFAATESFLFSTLARDANFDEISAALDQLAVPRTRSRAAAGTDIVSLGDNMAATVAAGMAFAEAMSELRVNGPELSAAASFWWTAGGGDFPPLALSCRGLPDPYRYSALLTADIGDSPCETPLAQGEK